jgi:hypothetical protein
MKGFFQARGCCFQVKPVSENPPYPGKISLLIRKNVPEILSICRSMAVWQRKTRT